MRIYAHTLQCTYINIYVNKTLVLFFILKYRWWTWRWLWLQLKYYDNFFYFNLVFMDCFNDTKCSSEIIFFRKLETTGKKPIILKLHVEFNKSCIQKNLYQIHTNFTKTSSWVQQKMHIYICMFNNWNKDCKYPQFWLSHMS